MSHSKVPKNSPLSDAPTLPTVALAVELVTVDYPGVRALDAVSIAFNRGEIHAIVGENGAGKSTLMKVLSGLVRPGGGTIRLDGVARIFARPLDAIRAGIAMVHQELNLVGALNVAENVMLGREPLTLAGLMIDRAEQRARAQHWLHMLGAELDIERACSDLSIADAQFVEIAKCLASNAQVLIFDEPTAVLGERDTKRLLALLQRLRDEGRVVIFISHHLDEVIAVADRVSVLRDGALMRTFTRSAQGVLVSEDGTRADEGTLAHAMVGRELGSMYPVKGVSNATIPAIEVTEFGAVGRSHGVSFAVRAGEIVGCAGLVGCGRTETAEAIIGLRQSSGSVRVAGLRVRLRSPRDAMKRGVAYVSEDRKGRGLHVTLSSITNMTLPSLSAYTRFGGRIDVRAEQSVATRWIDALSIRCAQPHAPISSLSGGNQQKFALARWLQTQPKVLIIDEPTLGVDVGAKAEIYRIIAQLAGEGLAVILISSELPELIGLAHRVLVMHAGTIVGEVTREQLEQRGAEERIVRLASGLTAEFGETKEILA